MEALWERMSALTGADSAQVNIRFKLGYICIPIYMYIDI